MACLAAAANSLQTFVQENDNKNQLSKKYFYQIAESLTRSVNRLQEGDDES